MLVFIFCTLAWVLFVSHSLSDGVHVMSHLLDGIGNPVEYIRQGMQGIQIGKMGLLRIGAVVGILFAYDYYSLRKDCITWISERKWYLRWPIYVGMVLLVAVLSQKGAATEFVYFQF